MNTIARFSLWEINKNLCALILILHIIGIVTFAARTYYFCAIHDSRRSLKGQLSYMIYELKPKYPEGQFDSFFVNVHSDRCLVCHGQLVVSLGILINFMTGTYEVLNYPAMAVALQSISSFVLYFVGIGVVRRLFRTSPTVCNTNLDSFWLFPRVNLGD